MDNRLDIPGNAIWVQVATNWLGELPKQGQRVELTHAMGYREAHGIVIQRSWAKRSVQVVPDGETINDPASWRVTE